MAQNEGRTLRRAPKSFLSQLTFFVVMLVLSLTFGLAVHELKAAAESALTTETSLKNTPATNPGADAGQKLLVGQVDAAAQPKDETSGVPNCTPASYRLPTPINLAGLPTGVTTIEDSTQQYIIYGNTAEQRLAQLQQCAPDGEFAGAASYQITWQYGYGVRADGLCQIVQPKVGLHLTMILPKWQADGASTADRQAWSQYIGALDLHERGHYSISKQFAATMLKGLQSLPAQQCATLKTSADTLLESKLTQLNVAQNNYDATTNHGATQGAAL